MAWLKGQEIGGYVQIPRKTRFMNAVQFGQGIGPFTTPKITITNAQIKALRATPKTLVAAPGANKILEFMSLWLMLDYATNVLSESADNLVVRYNNTTGVIASQVIECTGFIDQAADMWTAGIPKVDPIATTAGCVNLPLVLHNNGDGEFAGNAGADCLLYAWCTYRIIDVSA